MRTLFLLFFTSLLIIACSDNKKMPRGILPQPKMQNVLWDMMSAGEYLNGFVFTKDSVDKTAESAKKYGQVLQFHHITKEQFEKSYQYYRQHPQMMKVLLDSLSKRLIKPEEIYQPKTDSVKRADSLKADSLKLTGVLLKAKADSIRALRDTIKVKRVMPKRRWDSIKLRQDTLRRKKLKKLAAK